MGREITVSISKQTNRQANRKVQRVGIKANFQNTNGSKAKPDGWTQR
jgi:hypothetical protein